MATVIVMPRLSPTMEEGVLLKWTKKVGDKIAAGDVIAEVETDKANMDFPLEDEGTLLKLLVKEGETVKLGAPVAIVGDAGEDPATAEGMVSAPAAPVADVTARFAVSGPVAAAPASTAAPVSAEAPASAPAAVPAAAPIPLPVDAAGSGGRLRASPLARKIAEERGVDLRTIAGSGPSGRVVLRDVEHAPPTVSGGPVAVIAPVRAAQDQLLAASPMRKTIARRLVEAKTTVPHFYLTMDADAEALWAFHEQLKAAAAEGGTADAPKVTLNDLIVKALAAALARVPAANASWTADGILRYARIDIGVAVSVEDGLITPVVRSADKKGLAELSRETRDLAARARARKLKPEEFTGATFSVSNLGMYGVREFAAIINPPESGILAVGALEKRAVPVTDAAGQDTIAIRRRMTLTMSCDHRVLDGALGATLLREVVRVIERPVVLAL